jgi:hypothetical protein
MGGAGDQRRGPARTVEVGLAFFAAALLVVATFLPRLHSPTNLIQGNRLVDEWEGAACLICSALLILGSWWSTKDRRGGVVVLAVGVIALGLTIYASTGSRTIIEHAVPGVAGAVHGEVAIGLLFAGFAAVVGVLAGILILSGDPRDA